jgi:hypothetical protein
MCRGEGEYTPWMKAKVDVALPSVMTAEYLRLACAACERAFGFLVSDFGYERKDVRFRWSGFALRYRGPVIGVLVDWYPRDPLTTWVVKLTDGEFPKRHPDTPLAYFDLGDVEAISGYRRTVQERDLYRTPNEEVAGALANSLRTCGADLLRGDMSRIPLLEQRVHDRTRDVLIATYGEDAARRLGW